MSIVWIVYFAGIANKFSTMIGVIGCILLLASSVLLASQYIDEKKTKWGATSSLAITCFILSALIPSERTIYMMCGASIAQDIANNPKTIATMDKVYKLIDSKLDEQLKSVNKEGK